MYEQPEYSINNNNIHGLVLQSGSRNGKVYANLIPRNFLSKSKQLTTKL